MAENSFQAKIQSGELSKLRPRGTISAMTKKRGPHKIKSWMVTDRQMEYPTRIKALRVEAGLTVEQLAELSNLSTGTISGIENGRQGYSRLSLTQIAGALGVQTAELLAIGDDEIAPIWALADKNQRKTIVSMARIIVGTNSDKPK